MVSLAVAAAVFGHRAPFLADDNPIGVGVEVDGAADGVALTEYLLLWTAPGRSSTTEAGSAWNPSKRPRYGMSFGRSASKNFPDRLVGPLGMGVRFGPGKALVEKPSVEFVVAQIAAEA